MKAFARFTVAVAFVSALSFISLARGQDGEHNHPVLEGQINQATAEIEALAAETREVREAVEANALADAALAARVEAIEALLEGGEPTDPDPVEPPDPALALYLITADGQKGQRVTGDLVIDGAFSLCAYTEDGVQGPVRFYRSGTLARSEGQAAYCLFGGNDAPFPAEEWFPGDYPVRVEAQNLPPFAFNVKINGATAPPPGNGGERLMQVGPWAPTPANIEEPYLNLLNTTRLYWKGCGGEGLQPDKIDQKTGLPFKPSGSCALTTEIMFPPGPNNPHWDDTWIAECDGDARLYFPDINPALQKKVGKCKFEITRNETTRDHSALAIADMRGPVTGLRVYRKRHADAVAAGKVYNPDFIEAIRGYDIARTMDLQSTNSVIIRSVDDLASMASLQWAATDWGNATGEPWFRYENPFQGQPLEAALAIGVEADNAVWMQAPITLGAAIEFFDARPDGDDRIQWAAAYADKATADALGTLQSPEWDRYADALVAALESSGYPSKRTLYLSVSNEVWNDGAAYWLTTRYARNMGLRLAGWLGIEGASQREAYGALVARLKVAMDGALKRAGREQAIVYPIEGQTAYLERTPFALRGAKAFIEKSGLRWADHAGAFGVSVSSYWGDDTFRHFMPESEWPAAIASDPEGTAKAFADFLIGSNVQGSLPWLREMWRKHQAEGQKYGVPFIGAYEGGSHLMRVGYIDPEWYRAFIWGEHGARVNRAVNDALAEAFPGVIISNYALAGSPGGQPWFEGPIGCKEPYCLSWVN